MKVAQNIADLVAYQPGKPLEETKRQYGLSKVHKLASNENPLPVSAAVKKALIDQIENINSYPDPAGFQLTQVLAKEWGCPADWIAIGNGSNEIIDLLIRTFCTPDEKVLTSRHAFIAYKLCAQAAGVQCLEADMTEDLTFDLEALSNQLSSDSKIKLVFIANPNNPTGTYVGRQKLEAFLDSHGHREDVLIVLDEAYNEFVRAQDFPDSRAWLEKYSNLLLLKTFSKVYGLAGLRIGALVGRPEILNFFHRVRNPFNVNMMAQAAAIAAVCDKGYLEKSKQVCWESLDYFYAELNKMGLSFCESQANFVLFDSRQDSAQIFEALLKKGVILRPVREYGLSTHLRMSVGMPESSQAAIGALQQALGR